MHDVCVLCNSVKAVQSSGAGASPCFVVAVLGAVGAKALRKHEPVPQPVMTWTRQPDTEISFKTSFCFNYIMTCLPILFASV